MAAEAHNPFWDFSLAVWGREAVEPACLDLQERHGLDVNLLLFCGWAGRRGRALDDADIARLIEAARPWREATVLPLRRLRKWLKGQSIAPGAAAGALRERIKDDELQAEAIQQDLFVEAIPVPEGTAGPVPEGTAGPVPEGTAGPVPEGTGGPAVTVANMAAYFAALGIAPDAGDTAHLANVLRGCHPELLPLEAVWLLAGHTKGR